MSGAMSQLRRKKGSRGILMRIRARDGDLCWVCGELMDFGLPSHDAMRPSIDHVVPIRDGGWHAMGNLKLAHQYCNGYRDKPSKRGCSEGALRVEVLTAKRQKFGVGSPVR
jgi:5-methylcytosine-specific restriction endonuclease McrA